VGPEREGPRVGGGTLGPALRGFVRAECDGFEASGTAGAAAAADDVGVMRAELGISWTRSSYACPQRSLVAIEKACVFFRRAYRENPFLLFLSLLKMFLLLITSQVYRGKQQNVLSSHNQYSCS
jgi:hypothetical protein